MNPDTAPAPATQPVLCWIDCVYRDRFFTDRFKTERETLVVHVARSADLRREVNLAVALRIPLPKWALSRMKTTLTAYLPRCGEANF